MITRIFIVFSFVFLLANEGYSQVRKYSNDFLNIGVSARGFAMSKAQVATVTDATSGYWNPAGLVGIENDFEVALMHSNYFGGLSKYDYAAFGTKIDDKSALGFSFIRWGVDDIQNTINLIDASGNVNYDNITSFSAADYAFLTSYARTLKKGLNVGGNFKVVYRQVGDFAKAWGFGLDAALQYEFKNWNVGAYARDVTTTVNTWTYNVSDRMAEVFTLTGNVIPKNSTEITAPRLWTGIGRTIELGKRFELVSELDFELSFDGQRNTLISSKSFNADPYWGVEVSFVDMVFLRGGLGSFQKVEAQVGDYSVTEAAASFGVGLKLKDVRLDYAYTDIGNNATSLYSNVFSITLEVNKRK